MLSQTCIRRLVLSQVGDIHHVLLPAAGSHCAVAIFAIETAQWGHRQLCCCHFSNCNNTMRTVAAVLDICNSNSIVGTLAVVLWNTFEVETQHSGDGGSCGVATLQ